MTIGVITANQGVITPKHLLPSSKPTLTSANAYSLPLDRLRGLGVMGVLVIQHIPPYPSVS